MNESQTVDTKASTPAVDRLLSSPPYGLNPEDKRQLLLEALHDSYRHHLVSCPAYRRFCERRGLGEAARFDRYEDFPFLPVQAFKENFDLLRSIDESQIKVRLQSSATSGVPSTVLVDAITAKRQVRALASVISEVLGPRRRPFLVLDVDPRGPAAGAMGARGAAVRGFLNLAREAEYFMHAPTGALELDERAFLEALERRVARGEPVVLLGFTYVLFLSAVAPLERAGRQFRLPDGSFVIHIGGWKNLEAQKVNKATFNRSASWVFGVPENHVVDFYGFTEQMGVTYPDNSLQHKQVPAFAEVIVRDPVTFKPVRDGQVGVLQFLSPVPHSYPGFSVLTDDLGTVVARDPVSGWNGTQFQVLGRAKSAEVRGCGDIMGEKVRAVRSPAEAATSPLHERKPRLLFGPSGTHVDTHDLDASVDLDTLPEVEDIEALATELMQGRAALDRYSVDELAALIGEAAQRWLDPSSPLVPLRQSGLLFLGGWCKAEALRATADRSLAAGGGRGALDGFRTVGARQITAQPRGLVCHWLSGNVPLLGMLTLAQCILSRNANLLKASSTFSTILPQLLHVFRGLETRVAGGRVLRGDDILRSIAVIYYSRDDSSSAETFSRVADVRLAWGGREAVESVMNLPRRYGTEDVIFGPRLSYMAIGRELLASERSMRRTARLAAVDASVFDQYACASPHTIFVEKGGVFSPRDFAACLASEMEKAAIRIPKQPPDAGTVSRIQSARMRSEFTGSLWTSTGTEWTVLYDEDAAAGLAEPCYSRVITVRALEDVLSAADLAHRGIQTIGIGLEGRRRIEFARAASARGAERFPDIGRMTYFDSPWDGVFPMERLVRWVSLGGPF